MWVWAASEPPDIFSNVSVPRRTSSKPNKPTQKTLDKLFVKGSAQLVAEAKRIGEDFITLSDAHTSLD